MTFTAQQVFGALRYAQEHELEAWEIAARARLTKGQVTAAVRDLCAAGILARRRDGKRTLFRINHVLVNP